MCGSNGNAHPSFPAFGRQLVPRDDMGFLIKSSSFDFVLMNNLPGCFDRVIVRPLGRASIESDGDWMRHCDAELRRVHLRFRNVSLVLIRYNESGRQTLACVLFVYNFI